MDAAASAADDGDEENLVFCSLAFAGPLRRPRRPPIEHRAPTMGSQTNRPSSSAEAERGGPADRPDRSPRQHKLM